MSNPLYKGIDVSKWQGAVNWATVKNSGIQFAIIRAGYGRYESQKDPQFEANYKNAKAVGMPVGAYWYSYATTVEQAKAEAKACLAVIKGKQFEYPVWFDQEYEESIKALTTAQRTAIVKAFCEVLENAGYYTGLYCSRDWLTNWLTSSQLSHLDVWVAAYTGGTSAGNVPLPYGIWQFSSGNALGVPGFGNSLDCNYAYKDYPSIIKNAGLNGFKAQSSSGSTGSAPAPEAKPALYKITTNEMTNGDRLSVTKLLDSLSIGYKVEQTQ